MKFVFTPDWFLGKDVLIEGFSFIILFIFFLLCVRYYKLSKKKNILYLGIGFLLIALAQLAVVMTKFVLYDYTTFTQHIGQMIVTYHILNSVDIFYKIGFFLQKFLTLVGFYIIYRLPEKKKSIGEFLLVLYFIIISAIASINLNFIFNITVLVLLAMIIENYYEVYKKGRNTNTLILIIAFSILALAHLIFTLSNMPFLFVTANILELISFIFLLVLIVRILRTDKPKIKVKK